MSRILITITILAQAAAVFAAGMLFDHAQNHPAMIALAIGGTLTLVELFSVTGVTVHIGGEKESK